MTSMFYCFARNCLTGHITSTNDGMCPISGCNRALQHCEVVAVSILAQKLKHFDISEGGVTLNLLCIY